VKRRLWLVVVIASAAWSPAALADELLLAPEVDVAGFFGTGHGGQVYVGTAAESGPRDGRTFSCNSAIVEPTLPAIGGGGGLKLGVGGPIAQVADVGIETWVRVGLGMGWVPGGVCYPRWRTQGEYLQLRGGDAEVALRADFGGLFAEVSGHGAIFRFVVAGPSEDWITAPGFTLGAGAALGYAFRTAFGRPEVRLCLDAGVLPGTWYGVGLGVNVLPRLALAWAF
jgi:hypothetical protein